MLFRSTGCPGKKVPFLKRLRGEVSMMERLITEGRGMTVVVLDTRNLPDTGKSEEQIKSAEKTTRHGQPRDGHGFVTAGALFWDSEVDKDEALRQLNELCVKKGVHDRDAALAALYDREREGGTFVGEEVILPHARIPGLRKALVAVGVGKNGIYNKSSERRVSLIFLLLSPVDPPESHISMLALIGKMAGDDRFRKSLLNADSPWKVARMIGEWEKIST